MRSYYTSKHAVNYNRTWKAFNQKTLAAAAAAIDVEKIGRDAAMHQVSRRLLDAGCGTGLLLESLAHLFPAAELYGIDASPAMLEQARQRLQGRPDLQLRCTRLSAETASALPYPPAFFDLITCTNMLHYLQEPLAVLQHFREMLVEHGQLVLEDYIPRGFPFLWKRVEWLIRVYDPEHRTLFSQEEAQRLCQQAGLSVMMARTFPIDFFCQGWVIRATRRENP